MRDFANYAAVEEYMKQTGIKVIIFEGTVYDVGTYLEAHPGGKDQILPYLGKCIDEAFEEVGHSKSARKCFRDLDTIGYITGDNTKSGNEVNIKGVEGTKLECKLSFDYNRGLIWQLFNANLQWDEYLKFVNEPKHLINPIRSIFLFDNFILENLTRTPWYFIPLAWIGPIIYFILQSQMNILWTVLYVLYGCALWSIGEYMLHRFLFHSEDYWLPNHPKVLPFHFLLHGIHHAFPMDPLRLVFPVVPGYLIMYLVFVTPIYHLVQPAAAGAVVAGVMMGYVTYDMVHYFMHHASPKSQYWKNLKRHHMLHHYKDGLLAFGVSSKFWDYVFMTTVNEDVKQK
jgi:4-hydroxysphinganine ceramide fatty acyl 2-hydroxylase